MTKREKEKYRKWLEKYNQAWDKLQEANPTEKAKIIRQLEALDTKARNAGFCTIIDIEDID